MLLMKKGGKTVAVTYVFRRIEKKYRVTAEEAEAVKEALRDVLLPDEFGVSTIGNLYLDTPDFLLIRRSIDAVSYKEKLRLRCYGRPTDDSKVFLELKKKYNGVVGKRRIALTLGEACAYFENGVPPREGQIMRELDYAMTLYRRPKPRLALFYEREAYAYRGEEGVRITFDTAVRYRADDLLLQHGWDGRKLLPDGTALMEIKCAGAMPLRLAHLLDERKIFPTRFSKYGAAYTELLREGAIPKPDAIDLKETLS